MTEKTFNMPPQASTFAGEIDALFYFVYWLSVFFFVVITAGTLYFAYKYRMKDGKSKLTSGFDHSWSLEIVWSLIPLVLFGIIFVWGWHSYIKLNTIPANAYEIRVIGQQWSWTYKYPDGGKSDSEKGLFVPVGRPIKLLMSSQDVIHSVFIPDFRVKMDCLPNRYTSLWFEAVAEGTYDLYCTEYCGKDHSRMYSRVHVLSEEDFQKKLVEINVPLTGKEVFDKYCVTCHSIDGTDNVGPTFKCLFGKDEQLEGGKTVKVDENYMRKSILEPNADIVLGRTGKMPTFKGILSDEEIDNVIQYIKTLPCE